MKYIYLILPIAFTLMTIRIIQVNYLKFVKGVETIDPESQEMNELMNTDMSGVEPETDKTDQKKPTANVENDL